MSTDTIGTSQQHATIIIWLGAIPVTITESETGQCADETFSELVNITGKGGSSATNFIRLTNQSGSAFDGIRDNGPVIDPTVAIDEDIIVIDEQFVEIDHLCLDGNSPASSGTNSIAAGIRMDAGGADSADAKVHHCVIYDVTTSKENYGIEAGGADQDIYRNAVHTIEGGTNDGNGIFLAFHDGGTITVQNNSVQGCENWGIYVGTSGSGVVCTCRNNVAMGNGTVGDLDFNYYAFSSGTTTTDKNVSSDASADDHGDGTHKINDTDTDNFTSVTAGSEDLHLVNSSADAVDFGVDLGTSPAGYGGDGIEVDIDGEDADAAAVTWDCGYHEEELPVAAAASIIPQIMHHRLLIAGS